MDDFTLHVLAKKDIVHAARFGRLDLVQQCLGQKEDEAICAAIKEGHTSVVEYLLDKVDGKNISDSVLEGIRNGNSKTIQVVMNSRLQGYVHFADVMVVLVDNNWFDMVGKFLNDERLELTPKEFDLLYLLASNPGTTYDRKKLLNLVWGYDFDGYEHTVNTHINRLRMKVEKDLNKPEYVLTTWGVGYRFNDQTE